MTPRTRNRLQRTLIGAVVALVVAFVVFALRPAPRPIDDNTYVVRGEVASVSSPRGDDVVITLVGDTEGEYVIDRGVEQGIDVNEWHKRLVGKRVGITVIRHWTPLDLKGRGRVLAELRLDDTVVFTRMDG